MGSNQKYLSVRINWVGDTHSEANNANDIYGMDGVTFCFVDWEIT